MLACFLGATGGGLPCNPNLTGASSCLQVFDLGAEGKDQSIRQVADMQDFMNHATYAAGGLPITLEHCAYP